MNLFFKNPETLLRMHEGPLGKYIDCYAAELHAEGYAQQSAELQIRLVADFSQWLAKRRISAAQITAEHFQRNSRFPRMWARLLLTICGTGGREHQSMRVSPRPGADPKLQGPTGDRFRGGTCADTSRD